MSTPGDYNVRAQWDVRAQWGVVQQVRAVRSLLGDSALANLVDAVYRPALEALEACANECHDATMAQAKRIAELEAEVATLRERLESAVMWDEEHLLDT